MTQLAPPQTWISPIENATVSMITSFFDSIVNIGPAKGRKHGGLDFSAPTGTPVYAPQDGVVKDIQWQPNSGGNVLIVEHTNGYQTVYAHLDSILVKVGDRVEQASQIATVGDSGFTSGSHLHWEVQRNGLKLDPLDLFDPFRDVSIVYRKAGDSIADFLRGQLADDIGKKTWGDLISFMPFGPVWNAPFSSGALNEAVRKLGWQDRTIQADDIDKIAEEIVNIGRDNPDDDPMQVIGRVAGSVGNVIAFLVDPANWARLFALVAGGILAFVGFRVMWEATNS